MANAYELEMQRKQTRAYIDADPDTITLLRSERMPDGAGGNVWSPAVPQEPITVRLINENQSVQQVERTVEGQTVTADFRLIADSDEDVQIGDQFVLHGNRYVVAYVYHDSEYEVMAEVAFLHKES